MGQNSSIQTSQVLSQRIRPSPGISGRSIRKGIISVYCENSHSIFTIKSTPEMTIEEVKKKLPYKNCDLRLDNLLLSNISTLDELGIDNKSLLCVIINDKIIHKSISTVDSFPEQELNKPIGPKKQQEEKPQMPNNESTSSIYII